MRSLPLSLGLRLPLDWRAQQQAGALPAFRGDVYGFLRGLGFGCCDFGFAMELREHEEKAALLSVEARACKEHGLSVAIHPTPARGEDDTAAWFGPTRDYQPGVRPVLEVAWAAAAAMGQPVQVVLHPAQFAYARAAADACAVRHEMVRRSRLFSADLQAQAAGSEYQPSGPPVLALAENQLPTRPDEDRMRIGDTCDELLAALSGCDLGICWDTGHYMLSVERYGLREQPSDEFLGRVRAVHLHDVVDGKDHRPISPRSGLLRRFLEMLRGQGFGGTVTLEYDLDAFAAGGGVERVLTASLETLAVWTSY